MRGRFGRRLLLCLGGGRSIGFNGSGLDGLVVRVGRDGVGQYLWLNLGLRGRGLACTRGHQVASFTQVPPHRLQVVRKAPNPQEVQR